MEAAFDCQAANCSETLNTSSNIPDTGILAGRLHIDNKSQANLINNLLIG